MAISPTNDLVFHSAVIGGMNAQRFHDFLAQTRLYLDPDEHVIFIYDGAPAHNNPAILRPNTELKKLPPYSPFMNIVEQAISSLKAAIKAQRSHSQVTQSVVTVRSHSHVSQSGDTATFCMSGVTIKCFSRVTQLGVTVGFHSQVTQSFVTVRRHSQVSQSGVIVKGHSQGSQSGVTVRCHSPVSQSGAPVKCHSQVS